MITTYFRSSSMNNWKYCEMQYFITYVLGWQSPSGKKADLGTMTHAVFESLALCKKRLQMGEKGKLTAEHEQLGVIPFTAKGLYTDSFVDGLIDKSFAFYSENCQHNSFDEADRAFVAKMVWDTLAHNNGQFDPRNRKIIDTEPHFDIPITEDWAKFTFDGPNGPITGNLAIKGTIDLVTDAGNGIIEVVDWKTGQRLDWATGQKKDYDKLMKDTQLLLYHYAVKKLYPKYDNIIMSIFFCRDGGPFSLLYDEDDSKMFMDYMKSLFSEIIKNQSPKPISWDRKSFKCQKLCHFYKNNWEGTDKPICNFIEDQIHSIGMAQTVAKHSKPGFVIGTYKDPGAVG